MKKKHIIVVDPTAFTGGSKIATESILALLDAKLFKITVLTADKHSWLNLCCNKVRLFEPKWLSHKEQGVGYFIRHAFIALQLLFIRLRFGQFDLAVGASGPGVDLSLYLLMPIMKFKIIQLVHGPVALSRTIKRCLLAAEEVHYLKSSEASICNTLYISIDQNSLPSHFHLLSNGLSETHWPSPCQMNYPQVFWAASLLKWKGLDTLLTAIEKMPQTPRPQTHICYIKPQGVQLPVTNAPRKINAVHWHHNPHNLDEVRASANIFVSTSQHEPFGLSILEALAAGQCVVIPEDGAYWDKVLTDRKNCIKYTPNDATDLHNKLQMLNQFMPLVRAIGEQSMIVAQQYKASNQYQHIVKSIRVQAKSNQPQNAVLRADI